MNSSIRCYYFELYSTLNINAVNAMSSLLLDMVIENGAYACNAVANFLPARQKSAGRSSAARSYTGKHEAIDLIDNHSKR